MDQFGISRLADWLEDNTQAILDKKVKLDLAEILAAVDYLGVLDRPAKTYLNQRQASYYRDESDHKLNLIDDQALLTNTQDRIMVNHVDGAVEDDEIKFTYNHEPVFDEGYHAKKDLNLLKYGLEVIGAAASTGHFDAVQHALSKDAVLSLILAGNQLVTWQA
ncbi:hypothetical protein [Lacticaseibacillus brantae]|uniref:Uncharacterized protein n=1 Tax=Lacticaseibacillus brantae DSM 23927 TaxID=1423727 RepID=A0A0R2B8X2_9LACO|nr:hypothetical protein [Lacticaseibacillus brantae]KRM72019.1 hypothetical protein FC34_GL001002 [Lacticaseibacillus brantae DSM 23927]